MIGELTLSSEQLVGNEEIDRQHLELFSIYNRAMQEWKLRGDMDNTLLQDLTSFAIRHFESEESFMESISYPHIAEQRSEHNRLLSTVEHMASTDTSILDIITFIGNWLEHHTRVTDGRLAAYLQSGKNDA